jgi:heptosyltransferase III
MSRSIAVIAASGIGDAILLQVLTTFAKLKGDRLTLFHPQAQALTSLFPDLMIKPLQLKAAKELLAPFDLIFVQNDHSAIAYEMDALRAKHALCPTVFIHPKRSKLEKKGDIVFDTNVAFVTNLIQGASNFFPKIELSKNAVKNAFEIDTNPAIDTNAVKNKKHTIALHPTSADPMRNWPLNKFVTLYKKLKEKGSSPYFIIKPDEQEPWKKAGVEAADLPLFNTLEDVKNKLTHANYLIGNDSGIGHLASLLGVKTVTISNNKKRVKVWRPDFSKGLIVTPWLLLPSFRSIHLPLRERFWHHFVSVNSVLNALETLRRDSP